MSRSRRSASAPTRSARPLLVAAGLVVLAVIGLTLWLMRDTHPSFDGDRALTLIEEQVALGPRTPGSDVHRQFPAWLEARLAPPPLPP